MRGLAYRLAEGLGVISQGEAREQWRLLNEEERGRLRQLGVREGQRFLYVAEAFAPHALQRRCMLTALFQQSPPPRGAPQEPVLEAAEFGGRDARAFGYAMLGTVALRIDIVERLGEALRHPHGAQQAHTLMQQLKMESGVRARILRELGGPSGNGSVKRRRRRRKPRRNGGGEGGTQGGGRSPVDGTGKSL
jgi:ATP-dependent RNA helicase SUPV3L1/SUV3